MHMPAWPWHINQHNAESPSSIMPLIQANSFSSVYPVLEQATKEPTP